MPAIAPTLIQPAVIGGDQPRTLVLRASSVAAGDFVDLKNNGYNPGMFRMMRVSVKTGTPTADKIRFATLADGMSATLHLESAGICACPDNVNEAGYLVNPSYHDTVVNLAGGGTVDLVLEFIP